MALKHFFVTVPLSTLAITIFFYYIVPFFGLTFEFYQMLTAILTVNLAATIIAIVLVKDDGTRRHSSRKGRQDT